MLDKKYIELIQTIAKRYGKEKQVLQAVEEMAELQKELIKNVNRNKDNKKEIILEIADVEIMLMQLVDIYNIEPNKLIGAIEYKLLRQKEWIENDSKTELN